MEQGEIYVEVDASSINGGIMPMAIVSGNSHPQDGQEAFGLWLKWYYNEDTGLGGFTGAGWFFDSPYNPIKTKGNFSTEKDFLDYLIKYHPANLDKFLGDWGNEDKSKFVEENQAKLGMGLCLTTIG